MKRIFTIFTIALVVSGLSQLEAQVVFSQDFEDGIEPMKLYDEDGLTPAANVSTYTMAWNLANPAFGNGTNVAISNSWYTPAGTADDWMTTPGITVDNAETILRWEAKAQDANFRDGYQVLISTTDDAVASFTEVAFESDAAGELDQWTTRQASLAAYVGQTIHIAWRNNSTDKFLLLVDNIFVGVPRANDISLVNGRVNITAGVALEGERNLEMDVQNVGSEAITSITTTYVFNTDDAITETIDVNIAPGTSTTISHPAPLNFEVGDDQNLIFSIDNVNGVEDTDNVQGQFENFKVWPPIPNFELTSSKGEVFNLYDVMNSDKVVVLDFFASWCGPCQVSTPELNSFYVANGAGDSNLEVFGVDIEPTDTDDVVNNLGWGATYPKFSFSQITNQLYAHFNTNLGLGENGIPFFVMVCPDEDDFGQSEVISSTVGFTAGMFTANYQPTHDDCVAGLTTSIKPITSLTDAKVFPNPANDQVQLEFALENAAQINVQVVNLLGQVVKDFGNQNFADGNNKIDVETSNYADGMYILKMTKGREISTFKFNVAH